MEQIVDIHKPVQRLAWIDWMKTIGMWTIICYHMFAPVTACHLSVVGVPLFFIMSGYLSKIEDDWTTFARKIWRTLLVPYFLLCAIRFGINLCFLQSAQTLHTFGTALGAWLLGFNKWHGVPGCNELWFVYVLIVIKIIYQLSQAKWLPVSVLALLAVAYSYLVPRYVVFSPDTYWGVLGLGLGLLFFLIGAVVRRWHRSILPKERWWHLVLLSLVSGVLFWKCGDWNGYTGIGIGWYGNRISLCVLGGVCGTLFVYGISRGLEALFAWFGIKNIAYVQWHSIGSIVVLAWHIPLLWLMQRIPWNFNIEWKACLYALTIQLLFTPLLWLVIRYCPRLLGRKL